MSAGFGQQPNRGLLDHRWIQWAAPSRAAIKVNAVGVMTGGVKRGVAMHHKGAMVARVRQEWLADPHQILVALVFERDTGAQARVDEDQARLLMVKGTARQKIPMTPRHLGAGLFKDLRIGLAFDRNPVAGKRGIAAKPCGPPWQIWMALAGIGLTRIEKTWR